MRPSGRFVFVPNILPNIKNPIALWRILVVWVLLQSENVSDTLRGSGETNLHNRHNLLFNMAGGSTCFGGIRGSRAANRKYNKLRAKHTAKANYDEEFDADETSTDERDKEALAAEGEGSALGEADGDGFRPRHRAYKGERLGHKPVKESPRSDSDTVTKGAVAIALSGPTPASPRSTTPGDSKKARTPSQHATPIAGSSPRRTPKNHRPKPALPAYITSTLSQLRSRASRQYHCSL